RAVRIGHGLAVVALQERIERIGARAGAGGIARTEGRVRAADAAKSAEPTAAVMVVTVMCALRALALRLALRGVLPVERVGELLRRDRAITVGVDLREQAVCLIGLAVLADGRIELRLADRAVAIGVEQPEELLAERIAIDQQRLLALALHGEQGVERRGC